MIDMADRRMGQYLEVKNRHISTHMHRKIWITTHLPYDL